MMLNVEYLIKDFRRGLPPKMLADTLDDLGEEGWDLVSVIHDYVVRYDEEANDLKDAAKMVDRFVFKLKP